MVQFQLATQDATTSKIVNRLSSLRVQQSAYPSLLVAAKLDFVCVLPTNEMSSVTISTASNNIPTAATIIRCFFPSNRSPERTTSPLKPFFSCNLYTVVFPHLLFREHVACRAQAHLGTYPRVPTWSGIVRHCYFPSVLGVFFLLSRVARHCVPEFQPPCTCSSTILARRLCNQYF